MALVQISNRLVVPPDGLTFKHGMNGELFGTAWMVLPVDGPEGGSTTSSRPATGAGRSSSTPATFKGPVAFWIPDAWSAVANGYAPAAGRTLDTRPAIMGGGAIEVNTVPYLSQQGSWRCSLLADPEAAVPEGRGQPHGPHAGRRDVPGRRRVFNPMKSWMDGGPGDLRGVHRRRHPPPVLRGAAASLRPAQDGDDRLRGERDDDAPGHAGLVLVRPAVDQRMGILARSTPPRDGDKLDGRSRRQTCPRDTGLKTQQFDPRPCPASRTASPAEASAPSGRRRGPCAGPSQSP